MATPRNEGPLTGEAHRRVEIGLRLGLARLEEAAAACEPLDTEHRRLIRQLVFEAKAVHESWCKAKELELRQTRIRM
jgi:hypothetical protein